MRDELEAKLLANRRIEDCGYETECWVWTASLNNMGYGRIWVAELHDRRLVHRVAASVWLDFDLDSPLCVLHRCDNPPCFNPSHFFVGTKADNTHDMMRKGRMRPGHVPGEANGRSILTERDVIAIRLLTDPHRRVPNGLYNELAERFGVSQILIRRVAKRRCWTHVH